VTTAVGAWAGFAPDQAPLVADVTPAVAIAVAQIRDTFARHPVLTRPTGDGGAHVVVDDIDLGGAWVQDITWVGLVVTHLHPETDCYPHWVRPDLARADGRDLVVPFHRDNVFADQPAVMVSRRTPNRDPRFHTPALKTLSVVEFVRGTT